MNLKKHFFPISAILITLALLFIVKEYFFVGNQYQRAKNHFNEKRYVEAIPLFSAVYRKNSPIKDYALYYLGEALQETKQFDQAEAVFRELIANYPANPYAAIAKYRLVQLKVDRGSSLSASERYDYALGLFMDRDYGPASVQFQKIVLERTLAQKRGEAFHYLGLCHFYLREYQIALNSFLLALRYPHPYTVKSLWWLARTDQQLNRVADAQVRYKQIYSSYPEEALAPEALAAAGRLATSMRRYAQADSLYALLRARYADHPLAGESYFQQGLNAYAQNDLKRAHAFFDEGSARAAKSPYGAALSFWLAKTATKLGKDKEALAKYKKTMVDYDHNYYAFRSAQILGKLMPRIRRNRLPWQDERLHWGRRYHVLIQQGAFNDAAAEIGTRLVTADPLIKTKTYYELAQAALDTGFYLEGLEYMELVTSYRDIPLSKFSYDFWRKFYPRPYFKIIKDESRRRSLPWQLINGLIREESKFQADNISYVGARGLMQLMPGTAQMMMRQNKFPIEILNDPRLNIELGTRYLAGLMKQFNNDEVLSLAGYNAGPHMVSRWLKKVPIVDKDLWIEMIPYGETRNYVKRVLRSYWEYQRIY